jgi:hypothetical protein
MISITNIDFNQNPNKYILKVNDEEICQFFHNRELSLEDCLRAAIAALPESTKPGMAIVFHTVLKDSDDVEVLANVGDFGVIIEPLMDGFKVLNRATGQELFVTREEFSIIRAA